MSTFTPKIVNAHWGTQVIGKKVHVFDQLDSTNSEAYRIARDGGEEGEIVVADRQLRGKGRLGRTWFSPPGLNLYVSILLRPPVNTRDAPFITLMAAVATARATEEVSGLRPRIKWPNDLLIQGKKIAGLLNEMRGKAGTVDCVILGIGINVNMTLKMMPEEIRSVATSLREELGYEVSRVEFLRVLLQEVEREYQALLAGETGRILRRWEDYSQMVGSLVELKSSDEVIRGKVEGIDPDGSLLLRAPDGSERRIIAGDISPLGDLP
jgi:BirA family biotin operon repressor/biotin-[acetyl-CoA-carboxylase] ligase